MTPGQLWRTVTRAGELGRLAWSARRVRRAETEEARTQAREALARHLGAAGGLPMKAGQFLAGLGDAGTLQPLVTGVPARPWNTLAPQVERALGRRIDEVFRDLDPQGLPASLGQVHRAVLANGDEVAVKVRLPGIADAVEGELRLAGLLPGAGPVRRFGMDLDGYKRMLRDTLARELDYRGEAARQVRLRAALGRPGLVVPRVHEELCSETVLVQAWEPGVPLAEAAAWPRRNRLEAGRMLLEALLRGAFVAGELHADPHDGNLRLRLTPAGRTEVVLYDFGCTLALSPDRRRALLKLIVATRERDAGAVLPALAACGFAVEKLQPLEGMLPELAWLLFEPFATDRAFDVAQWRLGERMASLLGDLRWWFRSAAPPEFILLMRAFHGLVRQLARLEATLPWWAVLEGVVGEAALEEARRWQPAPVVAGSAPSLRSRLLRVSIHEGEREVVGVALPAHEAFDLPRVVPEPVLVRLREERFDFEALGRRLQATAAAPQDVFRHESGGRRYRVWLE